MTDPRGRHVTLQKPKEDADPDSMHHGGSFGKYMQFKQQKLREQFRDERRAEQGASNLFSGISIHVNGFTNPTHQELRQIMAAHGGTFEVYYTRQRVTHIVCSNLPNAKIKALQKERAATPIVRPEWIVDSMKAGRVLPHNDYLLWRLRDKPGQSTLGAFEAQPVSRSSVLHADVAKVAHDAVHQPAFVPVSASKHGSDRVQQACSVPENASEAPTPSMEPQRTALKAGRCSAEPAAALSQPADPLSHSAHLAIRPFFDLASDMDAIPDTPQDLGDDPEDDASSSEAATDHKAVHLQRLAQQNAVDSAMNLVGDTAPPPHFNSKGIPPISTVTPTSPGKSNGPSRQAGDQEGNDEDPTGKESRIQHDFRRERDSTSLDSRAHRDVALPNVERLDATEIVAVPGSCFERPVAGDALRNVDTKGISRLANVGESRTAPLLRESDDMKRKMGEEQTSFGWQSSLEDASPIQPLDTFKKADPHKPERAGPLLEGNLAKAQKVAAACRAACDLLKGAPKSSREDPKFMDNYYKSSRLHFIGTWKARIEALAMADANRAKSQAQSVANRKSTRTILHLDMDCFFASVAALTDPSLKDLPLAVCHSNSAHGTGEVSSANYLARATGIRADMGIGEAKRLCPDLVVMPYQYDKYQTISEQVYKILLQVTASVQPVSCDEAFLDITGLGDPEELAAAIRDKIFSATGCTASAGISQNMLLARLATKIAKPNGQHTLDKSQVEQHLLPLDVGSLPGCGWSMRQKLVAMGVNTVADLRCSSEAALQKDLGTKNGSSIWAAAHGLDDRQVEPMKLRRSVGAEVNWGIRFTCEADAESFLEGIAGEVHTRMVEAGVKGKSISLKLKRRKSDAPEPYKFLGHGPCDNVSRSVTLNRFTDSVADLTTESRTLLRALRVPATQIRGIGISVSKLDNDLANASSGTNRMALPRPAQPPSLFRPRTKASDPYEDTGVSYHTARAQDAFADQHKGHQKDSVADAAKFAVPRPPVERMVNPEGPRHPADEDQNPNPQPAAGEVSRQSIAPHATTLRHVVSHSSEPLLIEEQGLQLNQAQNTRPSETASFLCAFKDIARMEDVQAQQSALHTIHAGPSHDREPSQPAAKNPLNAADGEASHGNLDAMTGIVQAGLDAETIRNAARVPGTPIQALPPASQLDASVLDALPLQLRREIERAYGIGVPKHVDQGAKRKRGTGHGQGVTRPIKRHFTEATRPARGISRFAGTEVVEDVLKELPLDLQQEVANDLARKNALGTLRPTHQSSFVQFPAPELEPQRDVEPAEDLTEEARHIWQKLDTALRTIALDYRDQQAVSLSEADAAIVDDLGILLADHTKNHVGTNLEGLAEILTRLALLATEHEVLLPFTQDWSSRIQESISEQYGGLRLRMQ